MKLITIDFLIEDNVFAKQVFLILSINLSVENVITPVLLAKAHPLLSAQIVVMNKNMVDYLKKEPVNAKKDIQKR